MIPIFDLDDTLYPERDYVESGFRAVAEWGAMRFGWPAAKSIDRMRDLLARHGRGKIFDLWLAEKHAHPSRRLVNAAVRAYRNHDPQISLPYEHRKLLERLAEKFPLYLVTDGHKVVQNKKILALGIAHLFSAIYITHRYGLSAAKPSPHCFDLIRRRASVDWKDLVYVGDNPRKDFVSLNRLGATTIRVLTGEYSCELGQLGYDATHRIQRLSEFPSLLERLARTSKGYSHLRPTP